MKIIFSSLFKRDLADAKGKYDTVSSRLGEDFHTRVKEKIRAIARWHGGDHVGPHGYPCKHCWPFPYLLYYQIEDDVLYIIGIAHERRHPSYLSAHWPER